MNYESPPPTIFSAPGGEDDPLSARLAVAKASRLARLP